MTYFSFWNLNIIQFYYIYDYNINKKYFIQHIVYLYYIMYNKESIIENFM